MLPPGIQAGPIGSPSPGGVDKLSSTRGLGIDHVPKREKKGTTVRLKIGALTVSALSVALVASGCSETKNESGGGEAKNNVQAGAISYDANDNKAPAPAVEGAN